MAIDGVLRKILQITMGRKCAAAFHRYGDEILDGMRWPAFLCGGLMAALAEEPFFRGVLS